MMLAAIAEIARVIEQAGWHRSFSARLTELETRQDGLTARLQDMLPGTPNIHPNTAEAYRRRIERLTEVPSHPDDALQATDAIRWIIDFLMVTPGEKQGRCIITIQGELGTILDWVGRSDKLGSKSDRGLPAARSDRRRYDILDSRLLTKVVLC
ncbi:hypothetical protein [Ollibium composti]|uniref:hypothetical protein n=1 Tax=Ollibium composti TaxID=2675109 RepID=UPI001454CC7D|nr:hypothetical protein [Mesorhizobium composti]